MPMKLRSRSRVILEWIVGNAFSIKETAELMHWKSQQLRYYLHQDRVVTPKLAATLRKYFGEAAVEITEE